MVVSDFKKNVMVINSKIKTVDDSVVALKPLKIIFPERYKDRELAMIGEVTYIVGFFCVCDEEYNYSVSMVPAMIKTSPDRINKIIVDDQPFTVFEYDAGSNLLDNMNVIMNDNLVYKIYNELLELARIPFYYGYEDVPMFLRETKKYNGFELGSDPVIFEYLTGFMYRNPNDMSESFRLMDDARKKIKTSKPILVGLSDVSVGSSNFITKVTKSYSTDGITSGLNNPSARAERIETMLRTT